MGQPLGSHPDRNLGGTLASIGAPYDYGTEGGTHHSPGDVGVVLTVPNTDVLVPGCAGELDRRLRATYAGGRLTYLRASVAQNDIAFDVAPGRLEVVRRGTRATVVVGPLLWRTLAACEGLDVTVLYTASAAPFDAPGLAAVAAPDPRVIAVEPFYEERCFRRSPTRSATCPRASPRSGFLGGSSRRTERPRSTTASSGWTSPASAIDRSRLSSAANGAGLRPVASIGPAGRPIPPPRRPSTPARRRGVPA